MESLTSSSSWKLFGNSCRNGGFSSYRSHFIKPELGFIRFQKSCSANFSHSMSLKAIKPVSCSSSSFSLESEGEDVETGEAPSEATYQSKTVHVKFQLRKECSFGEQFLLVGDDPIFGVWNPSDAIPLVWSDGHIWSVELDIPVGKFIQFKFLLKGATEDVEWQPGPDRVLQTWETKNTILVAEDWEDVEAQTITEEEPLTNPYEEPIVSPELNVTELMSYPNEDLLVSENGSYPQEEELVPGNVSYPKEEQLVAENMTHPKEELLVSEDIYYPKEEQPLAAQDQDVGGSTGIAVTSNQPMSTKDEDDLFVYEGEPVLVPGLVPLPKAAPEVALSAADESKIKNASVEINTNAVEAEGNNEPEIHEKQEQQLDGIALQEDTIVGPPDDESEKEQNEAEIEEPLIQLEQGNVLETVKSDFNWAHKGLHKVLKSLGFL